MLLTVQQKYILEVLRKLGFMRRRQLAVLLGKKFQHPGSEISEVRLDAMLRQLWAGNSGVFLDGDLVRLSGARPDTLCLEAVDVMLELAEGVPEDFTTRVERPGILRFSWGDNLRLFIVAELSAPIRPTIEALSQQKRVVWITENSAAHPAGSVPAGLTLPAGHFFAARLEDGSHRFYGSNGP